MTKTELLKIAKPILFNTEMVRAILNSKKTVTRRVIKLKYNNTHHEMFTNKYGTRLIEIQNDVEGETFGRNQDGSTWRKLRGYIEPKPLYKKGDYLYVREAFCPDYFYESIAGYRSGAMRGNRNAYKADYCKEIIGDVVPEPKWTPSIHMPKEAARIFLQVTDVRAERIQDIDDNGVVAEGLQIGYPFDELWDSTIKKADLPLYGWDANPYVFVIEFERVIEDEKMK